MKNKQLIKLVGYSFLVFFLALIQLSQGVDANTISAGSGNRIHFINTKANLGVTPSFWKAMVTML